MKTVAGLDVYKDSANRTQYTMKAKYFHFALRSVCTNFS